MNSNSARETEVRAIIERISAAWRCKQFEGFNDCFDLNAVIVGPEYAEFARGRDQCAESYREFAMNAAVLSYTESNPSLNIWDCTAVYTFAWDMSYQRESGPIHETGADQMVFQLSQRGWQLVWRYIFFNPAL
jgi:hypothetical protein